MASAVKRAHDDTVGSGVSGLDSNGPPPNKKKLVSQPQRIGPVSTNEELDIEVLRFQHKKLKQRVEQRQRNELALLERIEQLEKRQTQDDAVLNVVNRYWNQLNEDIRVLLQRFDTETSDESESKNESEPTTSFLTQLSTWDKDELDEKLANRVQVSTRAVAKIIQAFDRLQQRSTKITDALESNPEYEVNEVIKETNIQLERENKKLQAINTSLHEKNHVMSLKTKEMVDRFTSAETKCDELKNQLEDANWELTKLHESSDKLSSQVQELQDKNKRLQQLCGSVDKKDVEFNDRKFGVSDIEIINLQKENEECKELAVNRLIELEKLHLTHREVLKELEQLKMDMKNLPEHVIVQTTEYTTLQSKFSVVYNDALQVRQALDETKNTLRNLNSTHLKTIEQMESEELLGQKKLRSEVMQLEDMLSQLRKEYEMLRIEFEQNLAANEQTGPINREMRHLITSLQNHNQQLKGDAHRYRRKYKDLLNELTNLKRKHDDLEMRLLTRSHDTNHDSGLDGFKDDDDSPSSSIPSYIPGQRIDPISPSSDSTRNHEAESSNDSLEISRMNDIRKDINNKKAIEESVIIRKLRNELKQAQLTQKDTKLLLDMYKGMGKEQRDRAQLMASEKKYRSECEELRQVLKRLQESQKEEKKKLADEEALTKIKLLEDQVHSLQKQVGAQKSEEETLITEMEVTGQAFEDMQEQNSRLILQLREKDNANFKLMSDRIKAAQLHNLAREELQQQNEKMQTLSKQVEAQNQVVRKLEEKERVLLTTLQQADLESLKRVQSTELSKRKAIESAQSAADLKLHLDKYHSQMKEAQQTVAEKTSALEAESFKTKRLQEELTLFRRRVDRLQKIEMAGNTDAVLQEEIREYKELLTCPSCKVKKKDAVLNKCFHVFCFDCLRTRYETRQRKCPKCNAAFGANDYHRLYLT